MTEEKLIGNLLANQGRLATWGFIGGGANYCFLWTKKFGKIGSFGFFFSSVTWPKISKIKLN
jgi:hypothetical protein